MRHLNGVYTQKYNVVHGSDGALFRGRYKSILVDADSYVLQLVRYKEFIARVKDRFFKQKIDKEIPASKGLAPGLDRIISSVVIRVNKKLQKDRKFKERLAHIESIILKGQT